MACACRQQSASPETRPDKLRADDGDGAWLLAGSARAASQALYALPGCVHCCPGGMLPALHAHRLLDAALLRMLHGCTLPTYAALNIVS